MSSAVLRRAAVSLVALAVSLVAPAGAAASLPAVAVNAVTAPLTNATAHTGVTVTAACSGGSTLVGGGAYDRVITNTTTGTTPATLPTNGLVMGGQSPSQGVQDSSGATGSTLFDLAATNGMADPSHWFGIANFTGVADPAGQDQAATFALCATGGPTSTVVATQSTTGINATQQVNPPVLTIATCPAGSTLIGGGATTQGAGQTNDGITPGNSGNLKPVASYPSSAAGVPAADGSTGATSWTAYGASGIPASSDVVTAYALCASAPAPPVQVAVSDVAGPDAQPGTTLTSAGATCPAGTRLLGGGYRVDETVAGTSGLESQQGWHMRGSYPATAPVNGWSANANSTTSATMPASEVADGTSDPATWEALMQAGGQSLPSGDSMNLHAYAMCDTPPLRTPTLTTTASAPVAAGDSISDTATLTGGAAPTGTITFKLYGPGDTGCSSAIATSTSAVSGNGPYQSQPFTPSVAGTYRWVAAYGGDGGNAMVAGTCGDPGESVAVTAVAGPVLAVNPGSVGVGGTVDVAWTGVAAPSSTDWVGLYVTGAADTSYLDWFYDGSCTQAVAASPSAAGSCGYAMPSVPGTYQLRLFAANGFTRLASSNTVTVTGTAATLTASPASVAVGGPVSVAFAGVASPHARDWVGVYRAGAPSGQYVDWFYDSSCTQTPATGALASGSCAYTMPGLPGTYEFRLFADDSYNLLATSGSVVVAPPTPVLSAGPASVAGGGAVSVSWSGVAPASSTDWVAVYQTGAPNGYVDWFYDSSCAKTPGGAAAEGSCGYAMPSAPGTYRFVLYARDGNTVLATSNTVTVTGTQASLTASPSGVGPGGQVTVTWSAVASPSGRDWIGLYPSGAGDGAYIDYVYDATCTSKPAASGKTSGSCTLTMPSAPGSYELRLFANDSYTRLATSNTVTVST